MTTLRTALCKRIGICLAAVSLLITEGRPASFPESACPRLEEAAAALAEGNLDRAARGFADVAADAVEPGFVRGFGQLGLAKVALARKDAQAALRACRVAIQDPQLPVWQRVLAEQQANRLERTLKGLPERDPALFRVPLPILPDPAKTLYVSAKGDDANDGSDGRPFATLTRARDAIRELKKSGGGELPEDGVRVLVEGVWDTCQPALVLTAEDSGRSGAPILYEGGQGKTAVFTGGVRLREWVPVKDSALRDRLNPEVRDRVLQADLKALGLTNWGDATGLKVRPELFVDDVPQTLARWPNSGFVHTGEIHGTNTFKVWGSIPGCRDGVFEFVEDRPLAWLDEPDVRLYGYWFWDWYEEFQRVASVDPARRAFKLAEPFSVYGYRKGQRYYAANLLRELDVPGEWYLDRTHGRVYWLPPEGKDLARANIVLSVSDQPFVSLDNVSHVLFRGLTFQEGRGDGIHIKDGSDCLIARCTLRRLGGDAIIIEGGLHHGVFGSVMHTLGCGGIRMTGGDRGTLTPGRHFVENCTVSDIARLRRTYAPAVHLDGCGNRIAHNLFERIPSSAMRIEGNDHLIELNSVRHVVEESDDQGGIDMFGNPLYRGVIIRWNRWSDIVGGTDCGAAGIRLDDMISGVVLYGNVFERCGARLFGGVQIHGGKENVVDNNLFLDCHAAVSFTAWDQARWSQGVAPFANQARKEPYLKRYPDLARLDQNPNVNFISRNLVLHGKDVFLRNSGASKTVLGVVSASWVSLEAQQGEDPQYLRALFDPLPLTEIGPYPHPWRVAQAEMP